MQKHRISIRVFRAPTEPHTCLDYMIKHQQVLSEFGIEMITSNNNKWVDNPGMYVIVAESHDTGEMMAGIRVQLAKGNQVLPIQKATENFDPRISDVVKAYDAAGVTGEITALWNSRKYKGIGLSKLLIAISTSILNQLKVTSLLGLCDTRNVETMKDNGGYVVESSIGNQGFFYYPKQNLVAWAIILKDPELVSFASENVRNLIFELRSNPIQKKIIVERDIELNLDFKLKIPSEQLFII